MPRANLVSQTGERIAIEFAAQNGVARDIRIRISVPDGRPMPPWFMAQIFDWRAGEGLVGAQHAVLQNPWGRDYLGMATLEMQIGPGFSPATYNQTWEFTAGGAPSDVRSLIDPMNGTARFRTDLHLAMN